MEIEKELKKFDITDAAIDSLSKKYMGLTINGLDDKEGFKVVSSARKVIKTYRINVEKKRKELTSDALEYQRRINSEAKRITSLLDPIESHLALEEKKISDELDRIKREKEQAEANKIQSRIKKLFDIGFKFDGIQYISDYVDSLKNKISIAALSIKAIDDSEFNSFCQNATHYFNSHLKEEQERKNKDEMERQELIKQRLELELQAKKLAEIEKIQADREKEHEEKRIYFDKKQVEITQDKGEQIDSQKIIKHNLVSKVYVLIDSRAINQFETMMIFICEKDAQDMALSFKDESHFYEIHEREVIK